MFICYILKSSLSPPLCKCSGKSTHSLGQLCFIECTFHRNQGCLCLLVRSRFFDIHEHSLYKAICQQAAGPGRVSFNSECRIPWSLMENPPNRGPLFIPWPRSYMFQLVLPILSVCGASSGPHSCFRALDGSANTGLWLPRRPSDVAQ